MPFDVHPQLLRALCAVIEQGSFTAAAERLGFTQSALSKQIASLETIAGAPLVERHARGVRPTESGRRIAARAATVLDQLDAISFDLEREERLLQGTVTLGAFPAAAVQLVPRALARLRAEHPHLHVDFHESSTETHLRRLRAGRLDLAIVAVGADATNETSEGIDLEPLPSGRLRVAVAAHHELAAAGTVTPDMLAEQDWVVGRPRAAEAHFGAWPTLPSPRIVASLTDWSARLGFVAAGLGVTTVPSLMAGSLPAGVVTIAVDDPALTMGALSLASPTANATPAVEALRRVLRQEAASIALPREA